jgi:Na+/melibiose symporter-like transporter
MSIYFASISDVVPEELRAPSFAIMLAGFYLGFSLAPSLPLLMSHFQVSLLSLFLVFLAFVISLFFFPETLPESVALYNREESNQQQTSRGGDDLVDFITKPFQKAVILNRNSMLRLLTIGSFFSSMVHSTDSNLVLFYVESHLNIRDHDIAKMFFVMGSVGIVMQSILIQPFIKCLGEKWLLVATFLCGTIHNLLYGLSKGKQGIFAALILSQFTKLNYPLLSSLVSKGASESEQGQIQGALFGAFC